MAKPTHKACLVEEYKDKDWAMKTKFTEISAIRESDKGNMVVNIPKWMMLFGKLIIMPIKDNNSNNQEDLGDEGSWDLPF